MTIDEKKAKLFTLSANKPLAEKIAKSAGIPLSNVEVIRFADGEITVNIEESVRGNHVFVIQPTSEPANDHLMEVLVLTDALKRASAASITIIMPYFGYSRQDRKVKSRQPITAKLVANLLTVAGVDRVVSIDLHAAQIQGFFDIPIDNFPAAPTLASYFRRKKLENVVVVSPDHGGVTRARVFASFFNAPLAIIDKRRPEPNKAEVMNIIGDVKGATCIMIDDIIDTGGTLMAGANALKEAGAKEVYAAATHGVLTSNATERLQNSVINEIVITDTIYLDPAKNQPKLKQLSIGALLGEAIIHILQDEPISQIFNRIQEDQ
ncbi:ribose-phosphate diphosphokinase [Acholeplasma laidlawii]|jgi:ribose-phosphate pyrophosphokinase|uniref:Ribose-phosphate pyrophosphokinase n=1 Tax=Acholeplasma laidlawii (strain PG-8A) TaxID=441768 RepID=A9NE81_ACHLI|nr:ribose-phosphate pyrophosphokinase [Acholeplasma laidlawii]ABX80661.1 ribose-phosphate pyrophosphokinase [Acholeplasma laidlawii PG-8A]OAN20002.1 ribose-phosphate pyrophosphokinase [Acholeplasma laidlawii]OED59717.1 ribose-phosphate pyrophosphokinase [Acholeplasma laidlawii]RED19143.1 ribose-phosphate pyrophosphokinase [Acholeplasma laidlawii]SQH56263.1 Ribose-phosphate pyrophosphokinase [Acholeplasma laidlawii]